MKDSNSAVVHRGRGRPTLPPAQRKRPRNVSVSDPAWDGLDTKIKLLGLKTISELLEKIGRDQIRTILVEDSSPQENSLPEDDSLLEDVPVFRRLKSLMAEPVAVFWSILAFVTRLCRQFSLEPSDDQVYRITLKACTIVFYVGYTMPDFLINNPSALIRWICYRIVLAQGLTTLVNRDTELILQEVDADEVERRLYKIAHALNVLETATRSPDYEALKMKTIDGLTIKQISRIFKLQGHSVSKVEVSLMIKQGLASFRQLFYLRDRSPGDGFGDGFNDEFNRVPVDELVRSPQILEDVRTYIQLALEEKLRQSQPRLENILLKTSHDPYLDFWLNEIDYDLESYNSLIRDRLAEKLKEHLIYKKGIIDRELAFCHTSDQIRDLLQRYASQEAGTDLSVDLLLSD